MYRISKKFGFAAGHILDGLPDGHKCGRPHGHNYVVEVRLGAPDVDDRGFVIDYGDLAPFGEWLTDKWDHRWLGAGPVTALGHQWDPVMLGNPTAERIAAHMRDWLTVWTGTLLGGELQRVLLPVEVAVSETEKTWAWV